MKTGIFTLLVIILMYQNINAGSISGTTSYSGSSTKTIYVAAFDNPNFDGSPISIIEMTLPGDYILNDLADGTYYMASAMTTNVEQMMPTDPYGFYATEQGLIPVVISGNNNITGIDISLIDGSEEYPNPFAKYYVQPNEVIQLPEETVYGVNPAIVFNGEVILLYKHDYSNAPSARIHEINPQTGELITTHYLSLQYLPNHISWIDKLVFRNGTLWALGGYGDPMGSGYIEGVFKVDISTNTSSNQIPTNQSSIGTVRGLACDGTNFYIGLNSFGQQGIVKFNPDEVTEIPSEFFINLGNQELDALTYGNGYIWVGLDKINQLNPLTNEFLGVKELPGDASQLYLNNRFCMYDENDNTIKYYNDITVDVIEGHTFNRSMNYSLAQNYPNPFNPSTSISYSIPKDGYVTLRVFDALGSEIELLENSYKSAGNYSYSFDASKLASGIYFYNVISGNFTETKKMLLMK